MTMATADEDGLQTRTACVRCGLPASVTVVTEDDDGRRTAQEFCLACAEKRPQPRSHAGRQALLSLVPGLMIKLGAVLAVLVFFADELGISGKRGFGWRQWAGGEIGALVLVVGALLRSGWVTISGLALMILSLGADDLRVGHSPGMGWREQAALAVAAVSVIVGLIWQRRQRLRGPSAGSGPDDAGGSGADAFRKTPPSGGGPSRDALPTSSRGETLH
jgi:hypothetical protein